MWSIGKLCCKYSTTTQLCRFCIAKNWIVPPLGWFNSLAGIVKRRFASYVKSHLATPSGDVSKKDCDATNCGHPTHPTSPYHFEKLRQTSATTSSSMPSSPYFGNRTQVDQYYEKDRMAAHSPVNNIDRRHRSPDPPPR